jgi:hypothetical protein
MTQYPSPSTGGEGAQSSGRKRYAPPKAPTQDDFGPPASGPPSSGPPNQPGVYQSGYPQSPVAGYPQPPQPGYAQPGYQQPPQPGYQQPPQPGYQQPPPAAYQPPAQPQYQQPPPAGSPPQQQPYPAGAYQPVAPPPGVTKPSALWPLSAVACLFFLPAAAVALYFSAQVGNRWNSGDYQGARKASTSALVAGIVAIAVGLCLIGALSSSS